jgi:hypothetical protein
LRPGPCRGRRTWAGRRGHPAASATRPAHQPRHALPFTSPLCAFPDKNRQDLRARLELGRSVIKEAHQESHTCPLLSGQRWCMPWPAANCTRMQPEPEYTSACSARGTRALTRTSHRTLVRRQAPSGPWMRRRRMSYWLPLAQGAAPGVLLWCQSPAPGPGVGDWACGGGARSCCSCELPCSIHLPSNGPLRG